eukprot:CAMPEP_0113901160 /NCGR_PEP_ID=MMETSP0780_2-20120614/21091_1 /TAXON_ID=652834 /ORGANISM="Palpitomonas bilix" /LENGTH=729 /DNA_ID=CAMNT_0000893725 /DNA_START=107 /DNA_END=2297 /DNA_ORIENTATION=- /assembly_acc=CAM_ASM_000599
MAPSKTREGSSEEETVLKEMKATPEEKKRLGLLKTFLADNNHKDKLSDAEILQMIRSKDHYDDAAFAVLEQAEKRNDWVGKKKEENAGGKSRDREDRKDNRGPGGRGRGQRLDRPREDRPRQDRPRQDRPRQDRPREDRPREDRPRRSREPNVTIKTGPTPVATSTSQADGKKSVPARKEEGRREKSHKPVQEARAVAPSLSGGMNYAAALKKGISKPAQAVAVPSRPAAVVQKAPEPEPEPEVVEPTVEEVQAIEEPVLEKAVVEEEVAEHVEEPEAEEHEEVKEQDEREETPVEAPVTLPKALDDGLMGLRFNFGSFGITPQDTEEEKVEEREEVEEPIEEGVKEDTVESSEVVEEESPKVEEVAEEKPAPSPAVGRDAEVVPPFESALKPETKLHSEAAAVGSVPSSSMPLHGIHGNPPFNQGYGAGYMPMNFATSQPNLGHQGEESAQSSAAFAAPSVPLAAAGAGNQYAGFSNYERRNYNSQSGSNELQKGRGAARQQGYNGHSGASVSQAPAPVHQQPNYMAPMQYSNYNMGGYQMPGMYPYFQQQQFQQYQQQQYMQQYYNQNPSGGHFGVAANAGGKQHHQQKGPYYNGNAGYGGEDPYGKSSGFAHAPAGVNPPQAQGMFGGQGSQGEGQRVAGGQSGKVQQVGGASNMGSFELPQQQQKPGNSFYPGQQQQPYQNFQSFPAKVGTVAMAVATKSSKEIDPSIFVCMYMLRGAQPERDIN